MPPKRHAVFAAFLAVHCGGMAASPEPEPLEAYAFQGVHYADRIAHHVIVQDLVDLAGALSFRVDAATEPPFDRPLREGDVLALFDRLFESDGKVLAMDPVRLTTQPPALQAQFSDFSDTFAALAAEVAYQPATDNRNWTTQFEGFRDASAFRAGRVDSPTELIRAIFLTLELNAIDRSQGVLRTSTVAPAENLPVHVTEAGLDLRELLSGLLAAVVFFRHAADTYMDEELDDQGRCRTATGLCSDNSSAVEGQPFTTLAHAWDQAFGAFGASTSYGRLDRRDLTRGRRFFDDSGDGRIDLAAEYNFGTAVLAAVRDEESASPLGFMDRAWNGFLGGRAIIADAGGALLDAEKTALREARDEAVGAWEQTIAATAIHFINDTIQAVCVCGDPGFQYDYSGFLEQATAWSALKAHALSLQLNPRSPLTPEDFGEIHRLIGDAPVQPVGPDPEAAIQAYIERLIDARTVLATAYAFDEANVGDQDGEGGW